jgi:hypothetical protein
MIELWLNIRQGEMLMKLLEVLDQMLYFDCDRPYFDNSFTLEVTKDEVVSFFEVYHKVSAGLKEAKELRQLEEGPWM